MSIFRQFTIPCPHCGREANHRLAVSISASRVPAIRQSILEDRFQAFSCGACKGAYTADGPFVYVDFEAGHFIGVFPREWEVSWRALEAEPLDSWRRAMVESAPPVVKEMAEKFIVRAVFGLPALRDKLISLDTGIDDRAMEVLKLDLMRSTDGLSLHAAARPSLMRAEPHELVFVVLGTKELRVARDRLDPIVNERARWAAAFDALGAGPYVDVGRLLLNGDQTIR